MDKNYYWYTVTVQFENEDEKTGKIKKTKENYLVKAVSITDAEASTVADLGNMSNYRILKADESKVVRVVIPNGVDIND